MFVDITHIFPTIIMFLFNIYKTNIITMYFIGVHGKQLMKF